MTSQEIKQILDCQIYPIDIPGDEDEIEFAVFKDTFIASNGHNIFMLNKQTMKFDKINYDSK